MEVDKYHFKHLVQNYYMIALSFLNGKWNLQLLIHIFRGS